MEPEAVVEPASSGGDLTPAWVKKSPPWIVSTVLHAALIVIATSLVFSETKARANQKVITIDRMPLTEWTQPNLPRSVEKRPKSDWKVIPTDPVLPVEEPEVISKTPKGEPEFLTNRDQRDLGPSIVLGPGGISAGEHGWPDGIGDRPVGGGPGGAPPQLKEGLNWLIAHQSPDGSWDCEGFQAQCEKNDCSGPGFEGYDVGVTSLAVLAFAGTGITPWHGRHRKTVLRAVEWLISQQDADGAIGRTDTEGWMYNHAIATMALCEVRAMAGAHAHRLRKSTDKAVAFCLRAQNPGYGWRYEPRSGDNDTSVTGWLILALKAARMAEMRVPDDAFRSARAYFDRVTGSGGNAGYRAADGASSYLAVQKGHYEQVPTMTAVAVLCRRLTGQSKRDEAIRDGADILLQSLPDPSPRMVNHYYWYYGTYAMFQATRGPHDTRWKKWQKALMKALVPAQRNDMEEDEYGSWDPTGEWGIAGGRVYSTAINLLTLEATFRYERMK